MTGRAPATLDPIRPADQQPTREQLAILEWFVRDIRDAAEFRAPVLADLSEITAADRAAATALNDYADRLAAQIAKTRHVQRQEATQ